MRKWKTNLHLNYSEESIICENLDINSRTFQGDSLSPLVFCLALTAHKIGEEKINHRFYMDDLKLYRKMTKNFTNFYVQ